MEKIKTKAKAFGTFNSPTTGQILYVDPNHSDEAHHAPEMTRAEAKYAFERGLIEDPEGAKAVKADDGPADPNAIENVALERTEQFAKQDDAGGPGSGTLDSRSSTAFADRDRVEGGVEGYAHGTEAQSGKTLGQDEGVVDHHSDDDDAPPAPKPAPAPSPAPAPAPAPAAAKAPAKDAKAAAPKPAPAAKPGEAPKPVASEKP